MFAIEHGMPSGEIATMAGLVDTCVRQGRSIASAWLPLLVVAAEAGYEYDGGSYWPLLRARLPSWGLKDREKLRTYFQRFVAEFGAFEPTGPWADKFNIIAWPVSHAVLPRVFLAQLAEILYELRGDLAQEEIAEPSRLGGIIETHALHASNRFREQASNVDVMGRIASALLTPEDAPTRACTHPGSTDQPAPDGRSASGINPSRSAGAIEQRHRAPLVPHTRGNKGEQRTDHRCHRGHERPGQERHPWSRNRQGGSAPQPSKLMMRVRFPSSAPRETPGQE